ncbi:hypothetical protein GH714_029424 [Hevea brasiliensis]|uniref:Urease accessory protein UreH-like transmembrane domain-containing protein n=1 Tax=Hevea brasiliensis TaxID=3981 RepID=A0A6A6ND79_HEVBR|nr:hypothetical protein GH714_029424 [Hevea brasiliensis]
MERLLHSSSPTPTLKFHLKPNPFLPPLRRFDLPKLGFPSLERPGFRRLNLVSCSHENPSTPSIKLPSLCPPPVYSRTGSIPKSHFPQQIANGASVQQKLIWGRLYTLSCHHVLNPPSFCFTSIATFQTAAKTGGPVAAAAVGAKLLRTELLSSAWTGFLAGCLHTLSGPDHLAALAPLSIGRSRMESAVVGALWGCAMMLVREASEAPNPCVALENGECDVSVYETLENPTVGKKKIGFATFATGIVHGLQPDALMMVLPALALPSRLAGAAFLVMFLLGTVVAMGSYTVFIGSCSQALKDRIPRITEKLTWISSLIAIALGLAIIISQFFGFSLY